MTREQFEQTVREMQDKGVPISMANLMVRTELPRAQIESWLDAMQRDVKFKAPAKPAPAEDTRSDTGGAAGMLARARALKNEVVGDATGAAIKSKLGLGSEDSAAGAKSKRDLKTAAVVGVVLPPAGLLYSAPWKVGATGSAAYAVLAFLAMNFPLIGIPYVLIPLHIAGGVLGGAYAWRYNRKGQRANLLPGGDEKKQKK